jgi:hypothetical protein
VGDSLAGLTDQDAARAEALIVGELPGKTHGQAERLAVQAALTVDPESAVRRREEAERNRARVALRREPSGAASLSGYDLPADEALAAHASVCARAAVYRDSGVFAGVRMDQFRAMAYLDLMNGVTAEARIAAGQPPAGLGAPNEYGQENTPDDADSPDAGPGCNRAPEADPANEDPDDGPGHDEPGGGGSPGPQAPPSPPSASSPEHPEHPEHPPRLADLIIPLSTLLGLAARPGEHHGLGPLDPALCRSLAASAASSPHTTLCVTVTDPDGIAIGHGCARPVKRGQPWPMSPRPRPELPARLNLTVPASRLHELACLPAGRKPWTFTPANALGPPVGYGSWHLILPNGRALTVKLGPVPTFDCDHRYQSHAYRPNDTLRHLIQVRDGECTFPTCSRHARESDFEHAVPYDKGGETCACNAGARSRACHQVKQSKGWSVTQPRPGWHQWTTPAGRTYTQGPKRYPV